MSFLNLRAVPYYPELSEKLGNEITASIVMTQLEYWFAKKSYAPFYKFLEPVSAKDAKGNDKSTFGYAEGDSWVEELNISKKSFKNAFSKIGVTYNSKAEFDKAEEKFKIGDTEFFYCCYTDRQTRQTYYYRNHKKVDDLCNEITSSKITYDEMPKSFPKKTQKLPKVISEKLQKGVSRSDERESPEVTKGNPSIIQEITTGDYQENKTITTTTETPNESQNSSGAISENIKNIRDYLLKNVKGINDKTCNNIIFSVENLDIQLERVITVVEYANKYQKQIGYICDALKYNWVIPSISSNTKKEKGRGHKINSEAITIAKESKEEVSEYTETLEQLTERYNSLDENLKNEIDKLALAKALKINPVERMAKVLVRTTTRLEVLRQYIQEGKI